MSNKTEPQVLPSAEDLDAHEAEKEISNADRRPLTPICPHCLDDPYKPAMIPFNADHVRMLIFFCGNCRKVTGTFLLPPAQPRIQMPGPAIVRPQ